MLKFYGLFALLVFAFFACNEEALPGTFEWSKEQGFSFEENYYSPDSLMYFKITDIQDSRCPQGATCIWAGMVRVKLSVHTSVVDTLWLDTYNNQSDTIHDFAFHLMNVSPYPELEKEIEKEDYKVSLRIFRI